MKPCYFFCFAIMFSTSIGCAKRDAEVDPLLIIAVLQYQDSMSKVTAEHFGVTLLENKDVFIRLPKNEKPSKSYLKNFNDLPYKVLGFLNTQDVKGGPYTVIAIESISSKSGDSTSVSCVFSPSVPLGSSGREYLLHFVNGYWQVYGLGLCWDS